MPPALNRAKAQHACVLRPPERGGAGCQSLIKTPMTGTPSSTSRAEAPYAVYPMTHAVKFHIIVHQRNSLPKAGKNRWRPCSCETWQKNGCQASEIKLRPSRRREAATVTTMAASSSRSDGHHVIVATRSDDSDRLVAAKRRPPRHHHLVVYVVVAKRRPRPFRRREAATVTTMTASSSRSDDHPVVVAKRPPRPSRRHAAIGRRFLSAFGHFPRAGRLRARPRKFMTRIYHTRNSE